MELAATSIHQYHIGETVISIELPAHLRIPDNMSLFSCGEIAANIHYQVREEQLNGEAINDIYRVFAPTQQIKREDRVILRRDNLECRLIYFHGADVPYGVYMEESQNEIEILVDPSVRGMLGYDTVFLSLFGLEKQMLRDAALILHCAYMCRDGRAVLFSAPSGTGKSTQADLWEKYRGTRTINGDKALLYRHEDGWYAHGWPICGSSEICHNESYPIEAIVMLHQAKENAIEPLRGITLVKRLMAQITINMWNTDFQMKAMDLIDDLIADVPVYELGCDISEEAVECLERTLDLA